jgi:DNA mismatch endonuclease (patch repair protein)
MAAIRSTGMRPEMIVRSLVHRLGYRFRLHSKDLPGKPDLVFPSRRAVIFVHGCFWHQHASGRCKIARVPKSNLGYWRPKLRRNVERDEKNRKKLRSLGWNMLVLWECSIPNRERLAARIRKFLERAQAP